MKLLTALRVLNGTLLLMALGVWALVAVLQWMGRFAKGAAQTAVNTAVLFGSGFQTVRRNPEPPGFDLATSLTGLTFFLLWVTVFFPRRMMLLHVAAGAGALLTAWTVYALRASLLGQASLLVLALWFAYYWAAQR